MIDKLDIASKNLADDYMTRFGSRFNNMLRDAFIVGFKKGVALSKPILCKDCKHHEVFKNGVNGWCNKHGSPTDVTYFCADGERRTDEQQT